MPKRTTSSTSDTDTTFYAKEVLMAKVPTGHNAEWRIHQCVSYNNVTYIRIQKWFQKSDGSWMHTRKMVTLDFEAAVFITNALVAALDKITAE